MVITGLPGSGKTTLATALAESMPACRMCPDDWMMAAAIGSAVELRYVTAPADELWRRIEQRDLEGGWGSRSITRSELDEWHLAYEPPTDDELATYDAQTTEPG